MTNQEIRVKALGLFAKAEYINDNLEFVKAEMNLSLQVSKGESYYALTVSIREYGEKVHYIVVTSAAYNVITNLHDISDLLDNYIEGIKEVI